MKIDDILYKLETLNSVTRNYIGAIKEYRSTIKKKYKPVPPYANNKNANKEWADSIIDQLHPIWTNEEAVFLLELKQYSHVPFDDVVKIMDEEEKQKHQVKL